MAYRVKDEAPPMRDKNISGRDVDGSATHVDSVAGGWEPFESRARKTQKAQSETGLFYLILWGG